MLLQVTLEGKIEENFETLFKISGYKSRTEFVRYLINQEYKNLPKEAKHEN